MQRSEPAESGGQGGPSMPSLTSVPLVCILFESGALHCYQPAAPEVTATAAASSTSTTTAAAAASVPASSSTQPSAARTPGKTETVSDTVSECSSQAMLCLVHWACSTNARDHTVL